MKETLLTCGKRISDYLNETKSQISTYEFKIPASDYKNQNYHQILYSKVPQVK